MMSCFCAFNLGKIPTAYENGMATYGNQHTKDIVSHYESALPARAVDGGFLSEWPQLKVTLAEKTTQRKIDPSAVYIDHLRQKPSELENILFLVEIMLTVSPSTAACERGFSALNRIKTNMRCNLGQESLSVS